MRGKIRLAQPLLENTARPPAQRPHAAHVLPHGADPVGRLAEHLEGTRQHLDDIAKLMKNLGTMTGPPVLETGTALLDAAGTWEAGRYRIPYKSVMVLNSTAQLLTVASMGRQGSAPGTGAGIIQIQANSFLAVNLEGSALSFYGLAASVITYSVMAGRLQPCAGTI